MPQQCRADERTTAQEASLHKHSLHRMGYAYAGRRKATLPVNVGQIKEAAVIVDVFDLHRTLTTERGDVGWRQPQCAAGRKLAGGSTASGDVGVQTQSQRLARTYLYRTHSKRLG